MNAASPDTPGWAPPANIHTNAETLRRFVPACHQTTRELWGWRRAKPDTVHEDLGSRLEYVRRGLSRSPFYLAWLHSHGLGPRDLNLRRLSDFPILQRPLLAEAGEELPALPESPEDRDDLVWVTSSGSSGQPVAVLRNGYECVHMWAVLNFWTRELGVELDPSPSIVLLCDLPGGLEYQAPIPMVADATLTRVSTHRPSPMDRLVAHRPQILFSDPTGLHWLSGQSEASRLAPALRLILTSAQHFGVAQRNALRHTLPTPVLNYYATTETGPIAWECLRTAGRFHVLLPHVWVEQSEHGLLITRLTPSPTPLLRYATGDEGQVLWRDCRCGIQGPCIEDLHGRHRCEFVTPDGHRVDAWQLAWIFKHHPVREFSLTQTGQQTFSVALSQHAHAADLLDQLANCLRRLGFPNPDIRQQAMVIPTPGSKAAPFRCTWRSLPHAKGGQNARARNVVR